MTSTRAGGTFAPVSPAAERNKQPILEQLRVHLPARGLVLEVASGTGQHAEYFAQHLPGLTWQPSEPDPGLRAAVAARLEAAGVTNTRAPIDLDATRREWGIARADAVIAINLIHIAPWSAAEGLVRGAATLLGARAPLVLYGPFRRDGAHTAESNAAFDAHLRARDPEWGVRDLEDVTGLARAEGFDLDDVAAMPANNILAVYRRRDR